jgi:uncharacterized protein (DUF2147 family)
MTHREDSVMNIKQIMATASCLLSLALSQAAPGIAWATPRTDPVGNWLTEDGHGVIRIERCAEGICGMIVGIDRAPGDPMPTDSVGRSQCGLVIFTGIGRDENGAAEGRITDPRDGKIYQAQLWLDDANRLHLRGYIGIPLLGATRVWQPFAGRITTGCRIA